MGKVYSAPDEIKLPEFDWTDIDASQKAEEQYVKHVSKFAKQTSKDKVNIDYIGEVFSIPMADSQASYVVWSLKPLALIHLPIGDAWDSPLADQVTASYIKKDIDGKRRMAQLFGKK